MKNILKQVSFVCLAVLGATSIQAAPIYKYVDANGVVSYTDQRVKGAKVMDFGGKSLSSALPMQRKAAATPADTRVKLETQQQSGRHHLLVHNTYHAPVEIELKLNQVSNLNSPTGTVKRMVIPARSKQVVKTLSPQNAAQPMQYTSELNYALGHPNIKPTTDKYPLAWRGGPFRLTQGPNGRYSHFTPKGRYALDIAMPVGTPIVAARGGVVVETLNTQEGRGPDPSGNYVRILHDDGTMGVYLHLEQFSVQVNEGQRVAAGQKIARSGNTGNSTGPHLHFVVQKNVGLAVESIPFDFNQPVNSVPNFAVGGN